VSGLVCACGVGTMAVLAGALCKGVHSVVGDGGLGLVLVVVCL
jgi:hypothetical protein